MAAAPPPQSAAAGLHPADLSTAAPQPSAAPAAPSATSGTSTTALPLPRPGAPSSPASSPPPGMPPGTPDRTEEPPALPPAPMPLPLSPPPPPSPPRPASPSKDTRYPFPLSTLEKALQIPPLDHMVGSHVSHLAAHRTGPASEVLAELLGVPQDMMTRLIWFGAVYYCPVPPLPPPAKGGGGGGGGGAPSLPPEQLAGIMALRQAAISKWGKHSRHQTPRRLTGNQEVAEGGYLRVHLHPKRFPVAYELVPEQWARRLLAVAPDHVVVNKPAGLQVPPTVDNVQESLLACVEKALSLEPGCLHPAHRLDAGTEGVVVLSRDPAFASYFRQLMGDKGGQRAVRKQYRCLVASPLPEGLVPSAAAVAVAPADAGSSTSIGGGAGGVGVHGSSNDDGCGVDGGSSNTGCSSDGDGDGGSSGIPLVHWVLEDQRQPGEAAHSVVVPEGTPGALRCELRIEQVEQVRLGPAAVSLWGVEEAHEVTLTLVTGRTHQVRVQMSAIGRPLLGDRLYGALASRQHQDQQRQQTAPGKALDWCLPALLDPLAPLALQAHSFTVLEDGRMGQAPARFCAGEPWWRTRSHGHTHLP